MNKPLLLQILRENRLLTAALPILLLLCGVIWYATAQQASQVAGQLEIWNDKRRQATFRSDTLGPGQYQRDQQQLRELYSTIPYRYEFPRVISELLDFMALRGATPGPMQYKPHKTDLTGLIAYTMNCSASGAYPGLKRLIADLERLDGVATLNSIALSNSNPAFEQVELKLQLTVYLREGQP